MVSGLHNTNNRLNTETSPLQWFVQRPKQALADFKEETNPSIWARLVSHHAPEFAQLTTVFLPYLTECLRLSGRVD